MLTDRGRYHYLHTVPATDWEAAPDDSVVNGIMVMLDDVDDGRARLKGDFNQVVDLDVDVMQLRSSGIWCEQVGALFGAADLTTA